MADSKDTAYYSPVEVIFTPKPDFQLLFDGMHCQQELGRPFEIHLEMSSGKPEGKVPSLIGSSCCIWMYNQDAKDHQTDRYFHGIVTRLVSSGLQGGAYRYKFEVRPWVWLLSQITDCKIFQKMTSAEIVKKVFRDAGFSDFDDKRQSGAGDQKLEYCVQYRETSLDFVTRLMEQYGFYYYFKHAKESHTLVLVDDNNAHELAAAEIPYTFDQTEYRTVDDHIYIWSTDVHLNSGRWTFNDYNFETPAADLLAKTVKDEDNRYGKFEVYEYPGPYETPDEGKRLSDVRMQALTREREIFTGQSNSRKLNAGWRFGLTKHLDHALNRQYLITKSVTTLSGAEGTPNENSETIDTYQVTMEGIPSDVPFRLRRQTKRPLIRGPQTAKVVGAAGDEITTDEHGRIKVKFHWDRATVSDEDRTCWIRVSQTWGGGSWGAVVIPRVGQEVVVEFLEGNPDRPLVTGVVYNGNNKTPYPLPDNKTRTSLKSNSSPGGGGSNEFRFEDKKGEEELFIHAEKDYNREVKNNETLKVKKDRTHTIEEGNDKLTVSQGGQTVTISAGDHKLDASAGSSAISAAQKITLTVGGTSIEISPSGIKLAGPMISIKASGTMDLDGGGMLTAKGGMISLN